MKVIDLLNKIANGEEVPKKIKYDNKYYTYNKEQDDYEIFTICHYDYLLDDINTFSSLNDEVEIIEEKPKYEKLTSWNGNIIKNLREKDVYSKKEINNYISVIMQTQNEIMEAVNYLLDKEANE